MEVRDLAVRLVGAVLDRHRSLDDVLAQELSADPIRSMDARDKGLARLIAATVLRRRGELDGAIATYIERPLPHRRRQLSPVGKQGRGHRIVGNMSQPVDSGKLQRQFLAGVKQTHERPHVLLVDVPVVVSIVGLVVLVVGGARLLTASSRAVRSP